MDLEKPTYLIISNEGRAILRIFAFKTFPLFLSRSIKKTEKF
jgi:hypothetical protein